MWLQTPDEDAKQLAKGVNRKRGEDGRSNCFNERHRQDISGRKSLDHVNFELRSGEVMALLGENGAGKSTLMKILSGVYTKDSGR